MARPAHVGRIPQMVKPFIFFKKLVESLRTNFDWAQHTPDFYLSGYLTVAVYRIVLRKTQELKYQIKHHIVKVIRE